MQDHALAPVVLPNIDAPNAFDRQDASPDSVFYNRPRLTLHFDDEAVRAVRALYAETLPRNARLLELGATWKTLLPHRFEKQSLVGIGMNEAELVTNPALTSAFVQDLNAKPTLPFADGTFDAVFCTNLAPYLARPEALFVEVRRVLRPGGRFVVVFGRRCFEERAVNVWRSADEHGRIALVHEYFERSATPPDRDWSRCVTDVRQSGSALFGTPVYLVYADAVAEAEAFLLSNGTATATAVSHGVR